jgi:pimeloyl-ACP methyl ester carboxylesterase
LSSGLLLVLLPAAALGAGLLYQRACAAYDRKRFRAPGHLMRAADAVLHVQAAGEGSPPVVLEAGIAASSLSWSLVHPGIARFTRVLSYDRAGFAWSAPCPCPRTPDQILSELDALVRSTSERCVLVGHSFGGLIALLYAVRFPNQVAGLVLVDPALTGEWARPSAKRLQMLQHGVKLSRRGALLCRFGVVRFALAMLTRGSRWLPQAVNRASSGGGASVTERLVGEVRKLPRELWPAIQSHWSRPECFESMAQHLETLPAVARAAAEAGPIGHLPLIVISGAHSGPEALDEHRKLAQLSSRGRHFTAGAGGHWVHLDEPETVVSAVREIVDQARADLIV